MRVTGITIFGGWHPHPNFYIFDAYGVRSDGSVIKICQHFLQCWPCTLMKYWFKGEAKEQFKMDFKKLPSFQASR